MEHIIYRTTNKINGRFYVGLHSTLKVDDGYLGSGTRLKSELRKYGKANFVREVLEVLPSRQALKLREAEIVDDTLLADPLCLNLKRGGEGGWDHVKNQAKISPLGNAAFIQRLRADTAFAEEFSAKSSTQMKAKHAAGKINYATFTGRKHSEATKQKMREAKKLRDQQRALAQGTTELVKVGVTLIDGVAVHGDA